MDYLPAWWLLLTGATSVGALLAAGLVAFLNRSEKR